MELASDPLSYKSLFRIIILNIIVTFKKHRGGNFVFVRGEASTWGFLFQCLFDASNTFHGETWGLSRLKGTKFNIIDTWWCESLERRMDWYFELGFDLLTGLVGVVFTLIQYCMNAGVF